jgi:hypothetical protein
VPEVLHVYLLNAELPPNSVCSWRRAAVRAEALASARVHRAVLSDPPQLKLVRYADSLYS